LNELIKISEEQKVTVQVVKSIFTISINNFEGSKEIDVTGISVIPQFLEVKPNDVRDSIIKKEQAKGGNIDIEENIRKGIYFVNISDYTSEEILFLSKHVTNKMLNEIWSLITTKELKPFSITLNDKKVREIILEENPDLFKTENELDNFCQKYGLSVNTFIEPANFSELDIKLKEIEARFEMEQFFARRYLFCSMLLEKLQNRISDFLKNGNIIDKIRLEIVETWIERTKSNLSVIKDFKDFHKLYDMPNIDKKIEITNSSNVNIIDGDVSKTKFHQNQTPSAKKESRFSKRVKIWTLVLMILGFIITVIINWGKIF